MTFREFLEELAQVDRLSDMELSPGPFILQVNEVDGQAARILMQLDDMIDDDTKLKHGEAILVHNAIRNMDPDTLHEDGWYTDESRAFFYAWWWLVFWAAQKKD